MVAGREATPKDAEATARLKAYWEHGKGSALIRWGEPHDFDRCVVEISKYAPSVAKGLCANMHHDVLGVWPGKEGPSK